MLGHLTGRMLLTREPYPVSIAAVIEAAAETGTIIELNANPRRLDMDWRWWPLAKQKGVKCVINPDAHSVSSLQNLIFGVGAARKGWLSREDVINTLPLGQIEVVLNAKRNEGAALMCAILRRNVPRVNAWRAPSGSFPAGRASRR